ncbi:MAG: hypothetical protein IT273_06095 [Chitinophagales bacterium]|nr:hypothetical protein [Chitinophagales bacterium]
MKSAFYLLLLLPICAWAQQNNSLSPEQRAALRPQTASPNTKKVFMPNSEYKRIDHSGNELPHTKNAHFSTPPPTAPLPNTDAQIVPVAPKYRRSTAELIQLLESKLDYLKSLPNSEAHRIERTQLEQQLFEARQRLSDEKECSPKH